MVYGMVSYSACYGMVSYSACYDMVSYIVWYDMVSYIAWYGMVSYSACYGMVSYIAWYGMVSYSACYGMVSYSACYGMVSYSTCFTGACGDGVSNVYMLKSVGDSTPPCGTPFLKWRCVDVLFLNVVYALRHLMFVWCSLCVSVCMLTVPNALLMSSATVIVRSGGLFWLKHVTMVLFMLCSAVFVEWLLLKP